MVKVEAVMQKFLSPASNNWDPIRVYVSQELVREMKDLKFGWGNENTHDTCHRGISPSPSFRYLWTSERSDARPRKGPTVRPICQRLMSGHMKLSQAVAQHATMG